MGWSTGMGCRSASMPNLTVLLSLLHSFTRTSSLIRTKRCTKYLALLRAAFPNIIRTSSKSLAAEARNRMHAIEGGHVALQALNSFMEDQPQGDQVWIFNFRAGRRVAPIEAGSGTSVNLPSHHFNTLLNLSNLLIPLNFHSKSQNLLSGKLLDFFLDLRGMTKKTVPQHIVMPQKYGKTY